MSILRLLLSAATLVTATFSASGQGLGRGSMDDPVTDWSTATADSLGLDAGALEQHRVRCEETQATACLVAYRGIIVQEWYAADYPADPVFMQPWIGTRSAAKSVFGILAGMLIDDGAIGGVDDEAATYIPEWQAGADSSVTIRHLLTMTSGVAKYAEGRRSPGVVAAKNTTAYVLGLPVDTRPGDKWAYSNEGAQLLSPILERAAGMPLAAYARERLFGPVGMETSMLMVDEYYNTVAIGGMHTRLREFARLGQLIANGGMWNGEKIVSGEWIDEMTTGVEQNPYYGYLWWVDEEYGAYTAAGTFDQVLTVIPDLDLVAVRLQRDAGPGRTGDYWGRETSALLRTVVPAGESGR